MFLSESLFVGLTFGICFLLIKTVISIDYDKLKETNTKGKTV